MALLFEIVSFTTNSLMLICYDDLIHSIRSCS